MTMTIIHELSFKDPSGKEILLSDYQNKVLLIVNTATKCGLAPQFEELEELQQKYKDQGLVVIGFPCAQFAGQEPESNETVEQACKVNFGVTFQLSEKIDVNGKNTHPVFDHLKKKSSSLFGRNIKWNFTKFLVSKDGEIIKRYAPATKPKSMEDDIKRMLSI